MSQNDDMVSRLAAIDAMSEAYEKDEIWENYEKRLNELSPVQAEIIRCKECVHADSFYNCDYMATWHDGECFCSHGKRRTDEGR